MVKTVLQGARASGRTGSAQRMRTRHQRDRVRGLPFVHRRTRPAPTRPAPARNGTLHVPRLHCGRRAPMRACVGCASRALPLPRPPRRSTGLQAARCATLMHATPHLCDWLCFARPLSANAPGPHERETSRCPTLGASHAQRVDAPGSMDNVYCMCVMRECCKFVARPAVYTRVRVGANEHEREREGALNTPLRSRADLGTSCHATCSTEMAGHMLKTPAMKRCKSGFSRDLRWA